MNPIQKGSPPLSFNEGPDGYHTENYLRLTNQTFRTGLSSSSYCQLNNIKAPSLRSGYYCNLQDCQFGTVAADGYCKSTGSAIERLTSEYYVDVDSSVIQSINATGYIKASQSHVTSIVGGYYVNLVNVKNVNSLQAEGFVKATDSSVDTLKSGYYVDLTGCQTESVTADGYVKAHNATIGALRSGYYVSLGDATATQIQCTRLEADNSKMVSVIADNNVNIKNCEVIERVIAEDMVGSLCGMLGILDIKSTVSLSECKNVAQIKSSEVSLNKCQVQGDVQAGKVTMRHSTVDGTLTAANRELKLVESHVKKLVMKKPMANSDLVAPDGGDVPASIASLVSAVQSGKAHISTTQRGGYQIQFDNVASRMQGLNLMSIGDVSISVSGGGGISMSNNVVIIGNSKFNIAKANIQATLAYLDQLANQPRNVQPAANAAPKPQTVIISGGSVDEVVFEEAGGIVLCENGGRVGKVTNGAQEDKKDLIPAEPPEHFIDPVHLEVMVNPYRTPLKHAFNYATLVQLADKKTKEFSCPLTRQKFTLDQCVPDDALKTEIHAWLKQFKPV